MRKIELKLRKMLRWLFGCVSFTAVAFVFQACYGMDRDMYYDVKLTGTVRSKTTNLPIERIKVSVDDWNGRNQSYGFTDENGRFDFYASIPENDYYKYYDSLFVAYPAGSVGVHFLDVDGIKNGEFEDKSIIIAPEHKNEVKIFVELEEKQ